MATMKYIGARYMPKFMGTYDATTAYEALSVVDNGAGTTYVANKPVPAGTPLSDSDYWIVYGASSGAILDLQNRMQSAEGNISSLQGDMSNAQEAITNLQGAMAAAQGDISALQTAAPHLYAQALKNRKILILGDSIADASNEWPAFLATELTGIATVTNMSQAGRRMTQLPGVIDSIATADWNYDLVIVALGTNDWGNGVALGNFGSDLTKYTDCIRESFTKISNKMFDSGQPYNDIIFITPLWRKNAESNALGFPLWYYAMPIMAYAKRYGARIINGYNFPCARTWPINKFSLYADDVHPATVYERVMARYILDKILSGCDNPDWIDGNLRHNVTENFYIYPDNGFLHFSGHKSVTVTANLTELVSTVNEFTDAIIPYAPAGLFDTSASPVKPLAGFSFKYNTNSLAIQASAWGSNDSVNAYVDFRFQPPWLTQVYNNN